MKIRIDEENLYFFRLLIKCFFNLCSIFWKSITNSAKFEAETGIRTVPVWFSKKNIASLEVSKEFSQRQTIFTRQTMRNHSSFKFRRAFVYLERYRINVFYRLNPLAVTAKCLSFIFLYCLSVSSSSCSYRRISRSSKMNRRRIIEVQKVRAL